MESKLEAYRLRKRRQEKLQQLKSAVQRMLALGTGSELETKKESHTIDVPSNNLKEVSLKKQTSDISSDSENEVSSSPGSDVEGQITDPKSDTHKEYISYTLKVCYLLFWATCFVIAVELQFGIVYLMFSALLGIYFNTRTGPKAKHEPSAYSVFNKNCEAIDGTLNADQFEREIRYGPSSVR